MTKKAKRIISLVVVSIILLMEILGTIAGRVLFGGYSFQYYTQNSNYFNLITCAIAIPFMVLAIKNENYEIPKWVRLLRFISTTCLALTFLVVICVLGPVNKNWSSLLFSPSNIFFHLLCPVFSMISFVSLEEGPKLKFLDTIYSFIPTFVYAVVLIIMAYILGWGKENNEAFIKAPYFFLNVYSQHILMSIMYGILIPGLGYGCGCAIWGATKLISNDKKIEKGE